MKRSHTMRIGVYLCCLLVAAAVAVGGCGRSGTKSTGVPPPRERALEPVTEAASTATPGPARYGNVTKAVQERAEPQTITIILNSAPYAGEAARNALQLADALVSAGATINIFLMADGVYCAKRGQRPPSGHYNAAKLLAQLMGRGVKVRVSAGCATERGMTAEDVIEGAVIAKVPELAQCVSETDKVISF